MHTDVQHKYLYTHMPTHYPLLFTHMCTHGNPVPTHQGDVENEHEGPRPQQGPSLEKVPADGGDEAVLQRVHGALVHGDGQHEGEHADGTADHGVGARRWLQHLHEASVAGVRYGRDCLVSPMCISVNDSVHKHEQGDSVWQACMAMDAHGRTAKR